MTSSRSRIAREWCLRRFWSGYAYKRHALVRRASSWNTAERIAQRELLSVTTGRVIVVDDRRVELLGGNAVLLLKQVADLSQQLGLGCRRLPGEEALAASVRLSQLVHRHDEDEVNDGCDDQEVDRGGDYGTEVDEGGRVALTDVEAQAELWGASQGRNQRVDNLVSESGDDSGERGTDNDGHCELNHVASHQEFLESRQHKNPLLKRYKRLRLLY